MVQQISQGMDDHDLKCISWALIVIREKLCLLQCTICKPFLSLINELISFACIISVIFLQNCIISQNHDFKLIKFMVLKNFLNCFMDFKLFWDSIIQNIIGFKEYSSSKVYWLYFLVYWMFLKGVLSRFKKKYMWKCMKF